MENMRQHSTRGHEEEDTEDAERMKNAQCTMHGTRSTCVDGVLGGSGTTCGRKSDGVVMTRGLIENGNVRVQGGNGDIYML
jgi:hypothetical protein